MNGKVNRIYLMGLAALLTLAACGGGGGGSSSPPPTSGTPSVPADCSLNERKQWVVDSLREWYLYPETLPANIDLSRYATLDELIDAISATARARIVTSPSEKSRVK